MVICLIKSNLFITHLITDITCDTTVLNKLYKSGYILHTSSSWASGGVYCGVCWGIMSACVLRSNCIFQQNQQRTIEAKLISVNVTPPGGCSFIAGIAIKQNVVWNRFKDESKVSSFPKYKENAEMRSTEYVGFNVVKCYISDERLFPIYCYSKRLVLK